MTTFVYDDAMRRLKSLGMLAILALIYIIATLAALCLAGIWTLIVKISKTWSHRRVPVVAPRD